MWFCAFYLAILFISCPHEVDALREPLNFTHAKTIKAIYGDIYDCVELYNQPALHHPLLKDHKIQMRSTFSSQKKDSKKISASKSRYGLKKCARGTVPIRRITKREQVQATAIFNQKFQISNRQEDRFAGVSITASRPNGKYHYIQGSVSTHQPQVGAGQLSGSVISVESGIPNSTFGVIRIGWMVYPDLYKGDNRTRLYTAWGQFDHKSAKGCFNTYCPGFVQVNRKIPLDMVIDQISVPDGKYDFIKLELRQLRPGESWWFIYWDGDNEEHIGYWPNVLFKNLKDGAEVVRWGGWVSSTTTNLPMMGSGMLGVHGGQVRRISATNDFTARLYGATKNREKYVYEQSKCYRAGPNRYRHPYWGDSVWYGGDAGDVKHCPP